MSRQCFTFENGLIKVLAEPLRSAPNTTTENPLWRVTVAVSLRNFGTYRELIFQTLPRADARALCAFFVRTAKVMILPESTARRHAAVDMHNRTCLENLASYVCRNPIKHSGAS